MAISEDLEFQVSPPFWMVKVVMLIVHLSILWLVNLTNIVSFNFIFAVLAVAGIYRCFQQLKSKFDRRPTPNVPLLLKRAAVRCFFNINLLMFI